MHGILWTVLCYRWIEVGRDSWRWYIPTALLRAGLQTQTAQLLWFLSITKYGDSTAPVGNTFQCSNLLILKIFQQAVLYFKLCPLFLVPPLDNTVESGSIFLMPLIRNGYTLIGFSQLLSSIQVTCCNSQTSVC